MLERFFCQNSTGKQEVCLSLKKLRFGLYAKWNRKADWEELQHSLKANKSLELLCSSRPKKGRVVVGSLKILLLLLFSAPRSRSRLFSSPVLRPSFYNVGREENFCAFKLSPWRQMTEIFSSATTGDYSQVKSYVVLPCDMFNTAYYLQAAPSTISQLFLFHSVWKSIKKGLIWQTLFLPSLLLLFWFVKVRPIHQLTNRFFFSIRISTKWDIL